MSTHVKDNDPLVAFMFILLRDHLAFGAVESILANHVESFDGKEYDYGPEYELARTFAERLGAPEKNSDL